MPDALFLRGLLIGFAIAAPVGAIGVLCIRRTLADGRLVGFVTGLGAATADAFYGAVAGFGLTAVSALLVGYQDAIRLLGGLFLLLLGARTWRSAPPAAAATSAAPGSLAAAWATTFALTLTNPSTILSFAAVFAGLGLADTGGDWRGALALIAGVFLGSATWWFLLSGGVSLLRGWFTPPRMAWVNRASGAVIAGFGALALASLVG